MPFYFFSSLFKYLIEIYPRIFYYILPFSYNFRETLIFRNAKRILRNAKSVQRRSRCRSNCNLPEKNDDNKYT
jgi:hypothetical protein